ncbi:MAG: AbrB/MazE/SpoVT family DNA-binding domain-containing protein [Nitrospirae bacterium]|nr:AbrB/MazE/SpoVT family DNA-binding domain-containing protein [Nitrospirota bacterium]
MAIVKTSAKGQVVIPRQEREKLGIKPGSKVIVEVVDDHIEIHPLPEEPVEYFCGIFSEDASLTKAPLSGFDHILAADDDSMCDRIEIFRKYCFSSVLGRNRI